MVQIRNIENNNPPDPIATQLAAIAAKLEIIETMNEDIAALKEGDRSRSKGSKNFDGESSWRGRQSYRPYNKIDFSNSSGGDPRGWLLKAEKYFRVLVNELKLATQPLAPFGVLIGNEDVIRCGQICKNLPVQINDLKTTQDFILFLLEVLI
nr:retrotransposon Gag domain, retroviral aspartyl protease [Tanacetum cinerariifolium]